MAIAEHVPTIITKLVEQARAGDVHAAKLLLERVVPPLRAVELSSEVQLPVGPLAQQGRAVLAAVGDGQLPPGQAAQLLAGFAALARIVETDELESRIRALEISRQRGA